MDDTKFQKVVVFINALIPLAFLAWDGFRGNLGANPIEFFLKTTGFLTLIFLLLTLAVTPLRKIFGWNSLIKVRRMLGLYAFFYCVLHFFTYSIFDKAFNLKSIAADILQRPFIALGMLSFFLMIPLAVTSTNAMIKKLGGKRWASLHKLTYWIAIGGVLHFYLIAKSDIFYPVLSGIILAVLLGYRYIKQPPKKIASLKES